MIGRDGCRQVLISMAVLALSVSLPTLQPVASAQDPTCLEFVPPLLFDTSWNDAAHPDNPRVHGIELMQFADIPFLIYSTGNNLQSRRISDPMNPGPTVTSGFGVPPWGDRDYNLFNFSVCDGCRYGFAGFEVQGSVMFDLGTGAFPIYLNFHYYADIGTIGAFTFKHEGQQYLAMNQHPNGCFEGFDSRPTLFTFSGVNPGQQVNLQCLHTAAGTNFVIHGGRYIPASKSDDGFAYVYIVDANKNVRIFRVTGSGTGLQLVYMGAPMAAQWIHGSGLRFDLDELDAPQAFPRVAVTATGYDLKLWDIEDTDTPVELYSWPFPVSKSNLAAVNYPYVFGAVKGTSNLVFMYQYCNDPFNPVLVDPDFWSMDDDHPWNTFNRSSAQDAVFTEDAGYLFFSRFSVLERIRVCVQLPNEIFADGFESGDTSAWEETFGN